MGPEAKSFLLELGRGLRQHTGELRSTSYLIQRISMAIQKGNAVAMMESLQHGRELDKLLQLILHVIVLSIVLYVLSLFISIFIFLLFFPLLCAYNNCIILLSCSVFLFTLLYSNNNYIQPQNHKLK